MKNQIVAINGQTGEYTGLNDGLHYFSMYNGSVIRTKSLDGIRDEFGNPLWKKSSLPLPLVGAFYPPSLYPCHIPMTF